ncbi:hypothetical protein LIER_31942 [Lithospermum erythrorhizon]|uniref:Alpha/beta hydrolase fold-3 domain-containing protein n=1 Tax=Lithospermum erythrorhizon TaxID=34254 RepID=A0AAV3RW38_LITER
MNLLASKANAIVVSVEYRLAPEHHLAAAYQDSWTALQWVASHFDDQIKDIEIDTWLINHGDFAKFFIGGDSAGGSIVHNMLMQARNEKLHAIDGIDNSMINPMKVGAPSLIGLPCKKLFVCCAEKDELRQRGLQYVEAVKKSGWMGEVKLRVRF